MQGLQPLFPADAIQHVVTQGMIDGKPGMIEVIGRIVMHADRLHDFLRRQVADRGKGHDFIQNQAIKPAA